MAEIYKRFNTEGDFSDEAAQEMYNYESRGGPAPIANGYFIGKHVMDLTVEMWKQDLRGDLDGEPLLRKFELYEDFPAWWLDRVL